jgi:hypothetical protein
LFIYIYAILNIVQGSKELLNITILNGYDLKFWTRKTRTVPGIERASHAEGTEPIELT